MGDVEVSAAVKVRFAGPGDEAVELAEQLIARGFDVQWSEVGEARSAFVATADRHEAVPAARAVDVLPWAVGGRTTTSFAAPAAGAV